MNKKTLLTLLVALMLGALGMQAATNYGINVGGKEVNTDNYASVTGGDIASGTVSYNPSTKVLTLTNVRISRTGGDNYGVHNRSVDGLTIRFVGTCNIQSDKANALHLDKSTTVQVSSGSTVNLTMTACANEGRGVVYVNNNQSTFNGGGTMVVSGQSGSKQAAGFEGTGKTSSSVIAFNNITLTTLDLLQNSFYKFKNVQFQAGVDVRLWANTGNYVMTEVGNVSFTSNTACVTPADASYDSSNSRYDATRYAHFTDNYGVIFSTANFPNSSFRSQLRSLGSVYLGIREQYLTPSELQNLTSLDVSAKNISDLTGVNKLTYLKTLNCSSNQLTSLPTLPSTLTSLTCSSNQLTSLPALPSTLTSLTCSSNQLTSLPSLPSTLTYLNCSSNSLTSLPTLPGGIQTVYASSNRFTTLTVSLKYSLTTLDVSSCTSLTSLTAYGNSALTSLNYSGCTALKTLTCDDNNLSSLGALPSSVTEFACYNNRLTSLPSLPSGLQKLQCYGNQLTSLPSLPSALTYLDCGNNQLTELPYLPNTIQTIKANNNKFTSLEIFRKENLKTLDVSNNTLLTSLDCCLNALTSLNYSGCTALRSLYCYSNQLTSLGALPNTLTFIRCENNQLTSLPALPSGLKTLYCGYNQLTSLPTLPSGIEAVYAGNNKFTSLSINSRSNLKTLDVSNCTSLTILHCYENALTSLSYSGCSELKTLKCYSNQLTSLPSLPSTLTSLTCSRNQLTSLPTLPSGLTELDCSDNQLKLLLTLPSGLTSLGCANNQLSILSVMNLSKLGTLICYGNKLTSLSVQGCNLLFMIQCFQNQIKGAEMTALVSSLPTMPDDGFSYGNLAVLFNTDEGNEISNSDVNIARDKGWIPCEFDGSNWVEIVNAGLPGDVDGSGAVDVTDVNIIINIMLGKLNAADYPNANVDGLGGIDVADVNMIVNIMLGKQ